MDYLVPALGIYQSQRFSTLQKGKFALCCLSVTVLTFVYALFFSRSWVLILVLLFCWHTSTIINFTASPHMCFLGAIAILEEDLWQYLCNAIMPLVFSRAYAKRAVQFAEQNFRTQSYDILCSYLYCAIPIKDINLIVCEYCACTPQVRKSNRRRMQIFAREAQIE